MKYSDVLIMKRRLPRFSLFTLLIFALVGVATAQPTLYIVRHAEKLANWPEDDTLNAFQPLSAEGVARAQKLAEQFKPGDLAAIFSSRTTRTLQTVLPLAQKLNLPIEAAEACMDTAAIPSFYKNLSQRFGAEKAVILVSHSNIIPYLLIKAGLRAACYQEMGIKPPEEGWLLIGGYENIWKVEKAHAREKTCTGFRRMKY